MALELYKQELCQEIICKDYAKDLGTKIAACEINNREGLWGREIGLV